MINYILAFLLIVCAGAGVIYLINDFTDYIIDKARVPLLIIHLKDGSKIKLKYEESLLNALNEWKNTNFSVTTVIRLKKRTYTFNTRNIVYIELKNIIL